MVRTRPGLPPRRRRPARTTQQQNRKQRTASRPRLEALEKRELLAGDLGTDWQPRGVFAPGTSGDTFNAFNGTGGDGSGDDSGSGDPSAILLGSRWSETALGAGPNLGDTATVTWSIVRDGTQILNANQSNFGTSDLVAFMDGIYGGAGVGVIDEKPWFRLFESIFEGYSETTGLNFVYEPNDDGVPMVRTDAIGVDGVRGDIRIAGDRIDGNGNVLAFNYEPANGGAIGLAGDMVIDTEDNFYANNADGPNGENRGLVNVLAHEAGHGIGLAHVLPVDGTKLMEPFINLGFLTVQEDDLWNTHILYGDYAEPNDTTTTAFDFGNLNAEVVDQVGLSIDDGATDRDVFSFSISSGTDISLSITPTGSQYQAGPQFGGPDVPVDRLREGDLGFRILDPFGVELIRVDEGAAGVAEIIDEFSLAADGTYFIEVFGTGNTQLYDFNLSVGETSDFARDTDSLRLISVTPNADEVLRRDALNLRESAPTELTLRFTGEQGIDPETIADGVRLRRAGNDGRTGTADDLLITPGFVGLGDNDRTIIMRFAEPLQDDRYRLEVFGEEPDALTLGGDAPMALRMTNGDAFAPRTRGTDRDTIDFELELGARINAIVPQPITRDASGDLDHHRERIDVYFDDDDLFAGGGTASLVDPSFYQLIRTADTTENTDDVSYLPISVTPVQFETQTLPDPITGAPVDIQVKVNRVQLEFAADLEDLAGTGAFRLKIGDSLPVAVTTTPPQETDLGLVADAASTFAAAQQITDFGNFASVRLSQSIVDTGLPFDYPGSNLGPGHRDQRDQNHFFEVGTDVDGQIQQLTYTFSLDQAYGADFNGTPLFTSINPTQIRRVREVFELYGELLGVDFVETSGAGDITVVLGDLAALGQTSGAGGLLGFSSAIPGALAIIDSAESWYDGYGTLAGQPSFFEVALHEIGHTIGLGSTFELPGGTIMGNEPVYAGGTDEFQYPGDHDVLHGRHLYRPDNRDVDIYRITAPEDGVLVAETFAERKQGSSTLDTYMQLFRETSEGPELVASNDDLFGNDSSITFDLESGESYFVAVTASGNEDFDGNVDGTGSGGSSQGDYQLLLNFTPAATNQILDAAGTPIDGDGDGVAGGAFDFWFRAAEASDTLYVDASNVQPGDGSLDNPYQTIASAMAAVAPGQIVRVVGNAGADGVVGLPQTNFANAEDNFAYEIGRIESLNRTLDDGENLVVPKDVTVMIDAGSVLKFLGSRIAVGSGQSGVDASGGALQILGVPHLPVFMTSLNDSQFGLESNPLQVAPSPADWGGIDIRNASDRDEGRLELEREGIFLNYVAGADIRYGGGSVRIDGQLTPIAPLRLDAARPTLINNQISVSADSAISADPDSFEETRFNDLRYQRDVAFVPDYDRVGPVMYGNTLTDNTINGVLVRLDVLPSGGREKLRTSARFDDTDIVHVLGNNLIIEGNPSGLSLAEVPNPLTLTQIAPTNVGTGSLPAGSYEYQLAFIDRFGVETLPTAATVAISVPADSDIELTDLPVATGDFVSRRLYRRQGGVGAFELVEELNRSDTSHVDGLLTPRPINPIAASEFTAKPDARLVIDAGLVIKSDSLHIETEFGGNLIAEGDNGLPVVFTSRFDDRYGAAGSFDTTSDGESQGAPGDWAGIFANPFSRVSIDNAVIAFGGGESTVGGSSVGFNAVGFLQSDVRITNTRFESNTTGVAGSQENRVGRGPNEPAVIFGVASQPILVGNSFFGTDGDDTAAISLNANAFIDQAVRDAGRQTGGVDLVDVRPGNHGPLIEDNRISEGGVAGVRIRSEILNTAVALDDTDIVHVVDGDLRVVDLHTVGGLRLQSRGDESLVVKFTDGSSLTADGRALDIDDRIGGSLHVIGQPGFPVVLTSLSDDTVGSGFTPSGAALLDTGGDGPTAGAPGDWAGVRLFEFSNDRNVATVVEAEGSLEARGDSNAISPQPLGTLATGEKASDDNLRLGFTVHGRIAQPEDTDSYSFTAKAGTTVWFDIDQTDAALDTVIELVDGAGQLIARSDDSDAEANQANPAVDFVDGAIARPMPQGVFAQRNAVSGSIHDYGTINPLDAGMRVELPGALGEDREFFIRVRGKDSSTGSYRLQLRLRELDEFGGSTVRLSEIRFASAGITVSGLPLHSPLTGEASVIAGNEDLAIDLGNLANTDRAALSIAGNITPGSPANIYDFRLERDSIEAGGDDTLIPLSFDIDYADNVGRPDTSILLYYAGVDGTDPPRLVMIGRDSNVSADQSGPLSGNDLTDLSRGSSGSQDAFLGTVELPAGEYVAVVVSDALIPSDLLQYFEATAANPNIRLEPINGFARIAEDRFGDPIVRPTTINPTPQGVAFTGDENAVPFAFGDSNMFVLRGTATGSRFDIHNPQIGDLEATVTAEYGTRLSAVTDLPNNTFLASDNLQIGEELNDANLQQMFILDDQGNITAAGDHGLNTFIAVGDQIEQHDIGVQIRAMTHFYRDPGVFNLDRMVGVGGRFGGAQYFNQAILGPDDAIIGNNPFQPAQNYLYRLNPATGEVINSATREREGAERTFGAGTQLVEMARIALPDPTNPGFEDDFLVTGITDFGNDFYAVTNEGHLIRVPIGSVPDVSGAVRGDAPTVGELVRVIEDEDGNPIPLTAIARGPERIETYGDALFLMTAGGDMIAVDTFGTRLDILGFAESEIDVDGGGVIGFAFSQLDVNLWHRTDVDGDVAGHGTSETLDESRLAADGQNSFRFGFDDPDGQLGIANAAIPTEALDTFNFPGGTQGGVESYALDLSGYAADDLPTMYFSYLLDTEDANSLIDSAATSRDSFRVYVNSEQNRDWTLVATNNDPRGFVDNDLLDSEDEIDVTINGFVNPDGRAQMVQQLFDDGQWRQARVTLAPWAGHNDVRIRFDFNTAGEVEFNALELRAAEPSVILDSGQFGFTIAPDGLGQIQFEFDLGLVMQLPGGAAIPNNSQITIRDAGSGAVFPLTFRNLPAGSPAGPLDVIYQSDMTAAEVAQAFVAKANSFADITFDPNNRERFTVTGSNSDFTVQAVTGLRIADVLVKPAGVAPGSVAIPIAINDTTVAVRDNMRRVFAEVVSPAPDTKEVFGLLDLSGDVDRLDPGSTELLTVENIDIVGDDRGITINVIDDGLGGQIEYEVCVETGLYAYLGEGEIELVTITYDVVDSLGERSTQTAVIRVVGVNDQPVGVIDFAETEVNTPVLIDVVSNDMDADENDILAPQLGSLAPDNGTIAVVGGQILYTPNPGFTGNDSFTYNVTDGFDTDTEVRVNVNVFADNLPPIGAGTPITATISESDPTTNVDLIGTATDPDGNNLGVLGLFTVSGDDSGIQFSRATNELIVDPSAYDRLSAGQVETVIFGYRVSDGSGNSVARQAIIDIVGTNDLSAPVDDGVFTIIEDTPALLDVTLNDFDIDENDVLVPVIDTPPANGTAVVVGTQIQYSPDPDYVGPDSFTYRTFDGSGASISVANVDVNVVPVNDSPVVPGDLPRVTVADTDPITSVDLLTGVTDVEGGALDVDNVRITAGSPDSISINGQTNQLVIDPAVHLRLAAGQSQVTEVTFDVVDREGGVTQRRIEVEITGTDQAPIAADETLFNRWDVGFDIDVAGGYYTVDQEYVAGSDFDIDNGSIVTLAFLDETGAPLLDGLGNPATQRTLDDELGFAFAQITLQTNPDGSQFFQYVPDLTYVPLGENPIPGRHLFSYHAVSDGVISNPAIVTLDLINQADNLPGAPAIDLPVAENSGRVIQLARDLETVPIPTRFTNPALLYVDSFENTLGDGDGIIFDPLRATATVDPTYYDYLAPGDNEDVRFRFNVQDQFGNKYQRFLRIVINGTQDAHEVVDDAFATAIDTPVVVPVLANDSPPESTETLTVTLAGAGPQSGTATVTPAGEILYTPNPGFEGFDSIQYIVNDGTDDSAIGTVTVLVGGLSTSASYGEDDGGTPTFDLLERYTGSVDFIDDYLVRSGNGAGLTLNETTNQVDIDLDEYQYLARGEREEIRFTYFIIDDAGRGFPRLGQITILGSNDGPTAVPDVDSTVIGRAINIEALTTFQKNEQDFDTDTSDVLRTRIVSQPDALPSDLDDPTTDSVPFGVVMVNPDQSIVFQPAPELGEREPFFPFPFVHEFPRTQTFEYSVTDLAGESTIVEVEITIHEPSGFPAFPPLPSDVEEDFTEDDDATTVFLLDPALNLFDPDGNPVETRKFEVTGGDDSGIEYDPDSDSVVVTPQAYDDLPDGAELVVNFQYEATDQAGNFYTMFGIFTIEGIDDVPIAVDDSFSTLEDAPLLIPVLENDEKIDNEPHVLALGTVAPANGQVIFFGTQAFYLPNPDFVGQDTFSYTIDDGTTISNEGLVTIDVRPVNDTPISTGPINFLAQSAQTRPDETAFQVFRDTVRMFGVEVIDSGALSAFGGYSPIARNVGLPGSAFGTYGSPVENGFDGSNFLLRANERSLNNDGRGVFIDDFIIGTAERGEMVFDASTGLVVTDNPIYEPLVIPTPFGTIPRDEVDFGEYQLEIRPSFEYLPFFTLGTNDSLSSSIGLSFVDRNTGLLISGADVPDGSVVRLSDGLQSVELEFNDVSNPDFITGVQSGRVPVPFRNTDTPAELAAALRDAINSDSVQDFIGIRASLADGSDGSSPIPSTNTTVLLDGPAAADLFGGAEFSGDPATFPITVLGFGVDFEGYQFGDSNRDRDQGQVILEGNVIFGSATYGIEVDSGRRSRADVVPLASGVLPRPGSTINYVTPNADELVPGVTVVNNILTENSRGGLLLSGDTGTGVAAPRPLARVLNNTIYGGGAGDVGVRVEEGAAPTLVNNALSNLGIGVQVVGLANDVELFGTLYNNVGTNSAGIGDGAFAIDDDTPLFTAPTIRNFYPVQGASLINSGLIGVDDRASLESLRLALGIAPSPIVAPERDVTGQLRADDPNADAGSGGDESSFIDRGAIDRTDINGPIAQIVDPQDLTGADADGIDGRDIEGNETFVQLLEGTKSQFEIRLEDVEGSGLEDISINAGNVIVTQNGTRLLPGRDYTFGYSAISNTILLTPASGLWDPDSAFEVTLNNRNRITLQATSGLGVTDGEQLIVRDNSGAEGIFEYDSGYVLKIEETLSMDIVSDAVSFIDRSTFSISRPDADGGAPTTVVFEFNRLGGIDAGNVEVDIAGAVTAEDVRDAIFDALNTALVDIGNGPEPVRDVLLLNPQTIGDERIQLGSVPGTVVSETINGLIVRGADEGIQDGDLLFYRSEGFALQFEFDFGDGPQSPATTNVIALEMTDTPDQIAGKIAEAMSTAGIGLRDARAVEDGTVYLGGQVGDQLSIDGTGISIVGTPGVTGKLLLTVPEDLIGTDVSGETIVVSSGGTEFTFLLTTDSTVVTGDRVVLLAGDDDASMIAEALGNEIGAAFGGELDIDAIDNVITLGEPDLVGGGAPTNTTLGLTASSLTSTGVGGGAIPIPFIPTADFNEDTMAGQIIAAITASGLSSTAFAPGGGLILIDRTESVVGGQVSQIGGIRDLAGNFLQPNRENRETQFTILMPGASLDFGDTPSRTFTGNFDDYLTQLSENGARHTITASQLPRLGSAVDAELDSFAASGDVDDNVSTISAVGTGAFSVAPTPRGSTIEIAATPPSLGDFLQIDIDTEVGGVVTSVSRTFQLITAGTVLAPSAGEGIIFVPDEPTEVLAQRIALAVTQQLRDIAPRVSVEYVIGRSNFEVVSVDDEDGLGIGSLVFDGQMLDGVLFDPANPSEIAGFLNPLDPDGTPVEVIASGSGLLDAWIDYNGDGDFTDPGELALRNVPLLDGPNTVIIDVPSSVGVAAATGAGMTRARFRISATGGTLPGGLVIGGEVEDYDVAIVAADLPVSVDDEYTIVEDGSLATQDVSANDDERSADDVLYRLARDAGNGTLTFNDDGSFSYVPDADFYGDDFFTYFIEGVREVAGVRYPVRSDLATVTITTTAVNDPPVAMDQNFVTLEESDTNSDTAIDITSDDLLQGALTHPDQLSLQPPWNEQEQVLSITQIEFADADGTMTPVVAAGASAMTFEVTSHVQNDAGDWIPAADMLVAWNGSEVTGLTYTPRPNINRDNPGFGGGQLLDSFVFTITDDGATTLPTGETLDPPLAGRTSQATATITVMPQNDAPIAADDLLGDGLTMSPVEDATTMIPLADLFANDSAGATAVLDPLGALVDLGSDDESGLSLVTTTSTGADIFPLTTPIGGLVEFDAANQQLLYTPPADYYGIDSFAYTVIDSGTNTDIDGVVTDDFKTATATVTLNIAPQNDVPGVVDKSFLTIEETALVIDAGDLIDGSVGDATPSRPAPQNESNQSMRVVALVADGVTIDASSGTGPFTTPNGQIEPVFNGAGSLISVTYLPATDFNSGPASVGGSGIQDEFEFVLADDGVTILPDGSTTTLPPATATGTARIQVTPVNDAPEFIAPMTFLASEDSPLETIGISGINAGGNEVQPIAVTAVSENPAITGAVSVTYNSPDTDASLTFTPVLNQVGTAIIVVTVEDGGDDNLLSTAGDNASTTRSITVTVGGVNDPPEIGSISDRTIDEDAVTQFVTISGLTNGPGEPGNPTVSATSSNPSLIANVSVGPLGPGGTRVLSFTPEPDQNGSATITVTATDPEGLFSTESFVVVVRSVNDPATFDPIDDLNIDEDTSGTLSITGLGGGGGEDQPLQLRIVSSNPDLLPIPTFDPLTTTSSRDFVLTPAANRFGSVTLTVTATDPGADGDFATQADNLSLTRTLTVNIINQDDPPTAIDDTVMTDEDAVVDIRLSDLLENDEDPDLGGNSGEVLTITLDSATTQLGVPITITDGVITYDPRDLESIQALGEGTTLSDSFVYILNDANGEDPAPTATVNITIDGINDAPEAVDDDAVFDSVNNTFIIRPLSNDSDVDGTINVNSLLVVTEPEFGSVDRQVVNGEVVLTYSPDETFTGIDSFTYSVADDTGARSRSAVVTIRPSLGPEIGDDLVTGLIGQSSTVDVLSNDVPQFGSLDVGSLRIESQPENGVVVINGDGTITFTPDENFVGADSFRYAVSDDQGNETISGPIEILVARSGRHNVRDRYDVNANGFVTPLDALIVLNHLRRERGEGQGNNSVAVMPGDMGPDFFDVNDSLTITPVDALQVLNEIRRRRSASSEGEFVGNFAALENLGSSYFVDTITEVVPHIDMPTGDAPREDVSGEAGLADFGGDDGDRWMESLALDQIADDDSNDDDDDEFRFKDDAFSAWV